MNFCEKCGMELQEGKCPKCNGKKNKFMIGGVIGAIVIALGGYLTYNSHINEKAEEYKAKALVELKEEKYKEADMNLEEYKKLKDSDEEVNGILEILDKYFEIENLFKEKNYSKVKKLIVKIKTENQYDKVNVGIEKIAEEINAIEKLDKEIKELDGKVNKLIGSNKYKEATELLDKYDKYELKVEQKNIINRLSKTVEEKKKKYDEVEKAKKAQREHDEKRNLIKGFWQEKEYVLEFRNSGQVAFWCTEVENNLYFADYIDGSKWDSKNGILSLDLGINDGEDPSGHDLARSMKIKFTNGNSLKISTDNGPWQVVNRITNQKATEILTELGVPGYLG